MNIERPDRSRFGLVVFSDLDQTLLDDRDYSHARAVPGLTLLKEKNIPLVLCTSKTRPEVEFHRSHLNNRHPFVVENGGAIYIPTDYFGFDFAYHCRTDDYFVLKLGTSYRAVVRALSKLKRETGIPLRGFSDMTLEEVATRCNLSLDHAAWAKQREYDEPFLISAPQALPAVIDAANIPITQGGRFFHLASSDKGQAVSKLMALFRRANPDVISVGIGDAFNDLPLFAAVDIPVLVQDIDGGYDPRITLPGLRYAEGIGPAGWNAAITSLVNGVSTGLTC
ncbi:MAG: HAD-IIB family hydrolase [Rhodospirillales bacterium]|nr:HAD-IIB family hydrolase [Rhodospirillales bacterium]